VFDSLEAALPHQAAGLDHHLGHGCVDRGACGHGSKHVALGDDPDQILSVEDEQGAGLLFPHPLDGLLQAVLGPVGERRLGHDLRDPYARSSIGTYDWFRGPMYSESGRISRLSASCSRTCADHPLIRLAANTQVIRSVGIPR
jgi:hypothetical protein